MGFPKFFTSKHSSADQAVEELPPPKEDEQGLTLVRDWTDAEERAAKRKLDLLVMPILTLGFFCLQLDRGNMANAITDDFQKNIGINQDSFNIGQQLLSLGIVLTEIPANMALYRVGPARWLTLQLFLFGIVSTFQAWQTNYSGFLATRFILGITESGFIPGGLWTMSQFYTRRETAKRVMFFYFGNQFGQASAKLLASGILRMRGVAGRPGWFWLFVLMGGFTILSGFVFGFFLPDSFHRPHSAFLPRARIFDDRQLHILQTRVLLDDPAKGKKKKSIGWPAFKKLFTHWRMWIHFLITMSNNGPQRAFDTYAPSLIGGFGYEAISANALAAVGLFVQIPVSWLFSWFSDHFNRRGETVMAGFTGHLLGYIFNRIFTELPASQRGAKYFGVIWTQTFGTFSHPLNITWMSLTCTDPEERALAMALVIMGANIAGIWGAQIFRADDNPLYRRAFSVNCAVLAFGLALALWRYLDDRRRGKFKQHRAIVDEQGPTSDSDEGEFKRDQKLAAPPADGQPVPVVLASGGTPVVSQGLRGTT